MVDHGQHPAEAGEAEQAGGGASPPLGEVADLRRQVAAYVAAGADESVQRVISAVHRVSRRLNQWYDQQLADLDVSGGEWTVLSEIARAAGEPADSDPAGVPGPCGAVVDDPSAGPDGRPGPGRPERVITAVHRVSRRLNQWYDQQLADLDVSGGEWTVLSEIARAEGNKMTPTQLATAAHVAPSSMTHRLDRMVERDLVDRTTDPTNRTRVLVGLTEPGWQLYATTIRESNMVETDLMRGLTGRQVDELAYLLEKLLAGLDDSPLEPVRGPLLREPVSRERRTPPAGGAAAG